MTNHLGFHVKLDNIDQAGNKKFLHRAPCQIMMKPINITSLTIKPIKSDFIKIIHVYYTYLLFSPVCFTYKNYIVKGLLEYMKIREFLNFTYILAHLPSNMEQFCLLINGLEQLREMEVNQSILLEDTHIYRLDEITKHYNLLPKSVYSYMFTQIKKYEVNLCLDTAHMYSNGLTTREITDLLQLAYDMGILKVIHLNGNSRNQQTSDHHVEFFSPDNKIPHYDEILAKINTFENITLIVELDEYDVDEYRENLREYKNITIFSK